MKKQPKKTSRRTSKTPKRRPPRQGTSNRGGARPGAGRKPAGYFEAPPAPELAETGPPLEATAESIEAHAAWLAQALAEGKVGPARAKELTQAQRTMLGVVREQNRMRMLTEMQELYAKIQEERADIDRVIEELRREGHDVQRLVALLDGGGKLH